MRINTNVSALAAQRSMSEHSKQVESTTGKLSQGTRVRNASDDAASLAIGTKTNSQIRSKGQALRNANDAISEFQIADGAMNEVGSMLIRLKELSIQAANGHLQDSDRGNLNFEYMALRREIERTIRSTSSNGFDVLRSTGGSQQREYQIGSGNDAQSKMTIDQGDFALSEFNLSIIDSNIVSADDARLNIGYIDQAMNKLSSNRAQVGALQNRMQSTINNLDTSKLNDSNSNSQRMDADFAFETSENIRAQGKLSAATAVLAQSHSFSAMTLKLFKD